MVLINDVLRGSPADLGGVKRGDYLIRINGKDVNDVLDYRYYITETRVKLLLHRGPDLINVVIRKPEYDDIGLVFDTFLMDEKRSCRNKCIFCFIDQLPSGMRDTLYFKDDDSRLSFLMGNYITLTNMDEHDISRIIEMKMSPINISVHATEPELRCKMLSNRFAGSCYDTMKRFAEAGIEMHCQIVLCRGVNDGEHLTRTMSDLKALYPSVTSVSVVPAGITKHREGLFPLTPFSSEESKRVVEQVESFAEECRRQLGSRIFFCADELYLDGECSFPSGEYYEGYPQLENGVGMIRSDSDEFYECLANLPDLEYNRKVSIATGYAAYDFIKGLASAANEKFQKLSVNVFPIRNDFFGGSVTVSGLVTGGDIIAQLRGRDLGDELLIPENMLRAEGDMFLDNVTLESLSTELSVPVRVVARGGFELCEAMTGMLCEL